MSRIAGGYATRPVPVPFIIRSFVINHDRKTDQSVKLENRDLATFIRPPMGNGFITQRCPTF